MKVLVIEESKWSNWREITDALKNHKQIELGFCDFSHAVSALDNLKVDICVIDACSGKDRQISTAPLVSKIRNRLFFKGKMIAISNIAYSRFPLMRAGCNYECAKGRLPELLLKLNKKGKI